MKTATVARLVVERVVVLAALYGLLTPHAGATTAQCEQRSSANRVAVLELYTSEGCNSCPAADRWLSSLPALGFSPDRLIPLAFHVDYWDQLGWPDRMAKAQFSARQRTQAGRNGARFVYTPQVLLDGADYRPFQAVNALASRIDGLNRMPATAALLLRHRQSSSGVSLDLDVRMPVAAAASAQTFVAITENRLDSAVEAGENRGKRLHHDFVVRELAGPFSGDGTGHVRWNAYLALRPHWKRADLSLVVFVQNARNGEMLQALQTPLCGTP